jgi:hypothetical protein
LTPEPFLTFLAHPPTPSSPRCPIITLSLLVPSPPYLSKSLTTYPPSPQCAIIMLSLFAPSPTPFIPFSHPPTPSSPRRPVITLSLLASSPPHLSQSLTHLLRPAHPASSSRYPYLLPLHPI